MKLFFKVRFDFSVCLYFLMLALSASAVTQNSSPVQIQDSNKNEAENLPNTKVLTLGIVDTSNRADFESKIQPFVISELSGCKKNECQFKNYTPYDEKGEYNSDQLLNQIPLMKEAQVVLFNFNEKSSLKSKSLINAIEKLIAGGALVVTAVGQPVKDESSAPLAQTVFGQVSKAIIIGELGEKYQLPSLSFFGPEMLTAIRPPKELIGKRLGPTLFAIKLLKDYRKRDNWYEYLHMKKSSCRKIWLELNDCFTR